MVYQSLKISQILGALLLQIYSQTDKDTGVGNLCQREFPGSGLSSSDEATQAAFKEFIKNTFYSALMLPFNAYEYKNKNKTEKVIVKVLQESLKKSNEVLKFVTGTIPFVQKATEFANKFAATESLNNNEKLELGLFLRDAGHHWNSIFLLAISQEYFNIHYQHLDHTTATSEFDI